jgi:hypothetical protein
MESVTEFEDIMNLGEREDDAEGGGEQEEEDMYTSVEIKIVRAAVNVMKCSKNVLGLVMKACDCVGERIENIVTTSDLTDVPKSKDATITLHHEAEMLEWISALHELARSIGEGVTDFGVLLYPPLEWNDSPRESDLHRQLNNQLQVLEKCVNCIRDASLPRSGVSMQSCMSDEVVENTERLMNGIRTRVAEVESAMS